MRQYDIIFHSKLVYKKSYNNYSPTKNIYSNTIVDIIFPSKHCTLPVPCQCTAVGVQSQYTPSASGSELGEYKSLYNSHAYDFQDVADDITAGVKSTAILFGDSGRVWLSAFASTMAALMVTSGYCAEQEWPFYLAVGVFAGHAAKKVEHNKYNDSTQRFNYKTQESRHDTIMIKTA